MSFNEKHLVILQLVTKLIVEACHQRTLRGRVSSLSGRQLDTSKSLINKGHHTPLHHLPTTARDNSSVAHERLAAITSRSFEAILPHQCRLRHHAVHDQSEHRTEEVFNAVFICPSTKVVHLEVVLIYTAEAARRYNASGARRGQCHCLYSDYNINFVGNDKQLWAFFIASSLKQRDIANQLINEQIQKFSEFNSPSTHCTLDLRGRSQVLQTSSLFFGC